ncbi:MAG: hypothetical protein HUU35_01465 [Armatimonadetes bacterium]|nr:hypothetical protein [Armatimonadota bacterium]
MQQAAEVKVGIFVVAVVILGVFIATTLKGGVGGGARSYDFEIWFDSAPGVGKGSPIRLAGVDIGEVIEKDIIQVTEAVAFEVPTRTTILPLERVKTWSSGRPGQKDHVTLVVERTPISLEDSRRTKEFERPRSVARLIVRVKRQYEMFSQFRYEISGGVVFGDRQLSVSDVGPDGMPLSEQERGASVPDARDDDRRVAVLGQGPASIDAIVSNAQKTLDEDTVARAQQVVANVERATNEASQLVEALRTTVQANQGNADRLMTNLAEASEEVQVTMSEARVTAGRALDNVDRLSATGRRVAEANEARLNRIAANLDDTTASFSRMARNNEGKLDRTMNDLAASAREVRGMIASNRESIDNIATSLSATAGEIRDMTGNSREKVESILTKVDESMTSVRDLLGKSDERLAAIIEDTQAVVADSRATVGAVRESIEPITANLRESSANLNTASRNAAALTADPATRQVLTNVERATAEARDLLTDIRTLTADPQVQENVRETTTSLRSAADRFNSTLGGLSAYKPSASLDVYYVPDRSAWQSDVSASLTGKGKTSFHLGADNITDDPVLNFQLGRRLALPGLRLRYGFYRSQLGIGADYSPFGNALLRADFYNPGDPQINAKLTYRTPWGFTGLVGLEDAFDRWDWMLGIQLGREVR